MIHTAKYRAKVHSIRLTEANERLIREYMKVTGEKNISYIINIAISNIQLECPDGTVLTKDGYSLAL
ncbi:MAG: hypothetical protein IJT16_00145 [Lachnospiraceae bacterium]|nr:hypothetical protein [Lachnospiraceae bacterium]